MLYLTCPTCGYFLGQKVIEYEKNKTLICNNPKLSVEEKETQLSKLVLDANLRRYCCKARLMTYKDIVENILPVPTNE
jgi:DNA-directed RNA polymerase subunit N (RpoN/RPB10)